MKGERGRARSRREEDGKKKGQKKWAEREIRFNDRLVRRRDRIAKERGKRGGETVGKRRVAPGTCVK